MTPRHPSQISSRPPLGHREWPWKPAAAVRNPELAYWLQRAELCFEHRPALSSDFVRALRAEIETLVRRTDPFDRLVAQAVGMLIVAGGAFLAIGGVGGLKQLAIASDVLGMPVPARIVPLAVVGFEVLRNSASVWIADRIARDRLNRWLLLPADVDLTESNEPRHERA